MSQSAVTSEGQGQPLLGLRVGHRAPPQMVRVFGVLGFCLLTGLFAQVRIPLPWTPVPMTLQSLAVLLCGMSLAPSAALCSMLLYVFLGMVFPVVLTPGSAGLWGVTGGYLVGFAAAAWIIAALVRGHRRFGRLVLAGGVGLVVLFALGAFWQRVFFGWSSRTVVSFGVLPFALKALLQLGVASTLVVSVGSCRRRRGLRPVDAADDVSCS